jgi:DNA excision repair protein ERCC-2
MENFTSEEAGALLELAVRDFVAPLERSGSLNQIRTFSLLGALRQVGAEIHAHIQEQEKASIPGYRCEVFLRQTLTLPQGLLRIAGRLDGLYENSQRVLIEEIKTTTNLYGLLSELENNPEHPYMLQAKMYAWMLAASSDFELGQRDLVTRMRLVSAHDPSEQKFMELPFTGDIWPEFGRWVERRARDLLVLHQQNRERQSERRLIGLGLAFPFAQVRPGQAELSAMVEQAIASGHRLLLQAPTGMGKTAGVLFPHLREALKEGRQVFYVTPKNTQHQVALEAVALLSNQGHAVRAVALTSKEKSCLKEEVICDPRVCEYAKDYYDKLKAKNTLETLASKGIVDFSVLQEQALQDQVCPFELSLDFTEHADVIIGDYNYVFSPNAALTRYFEDEARSHLVHLIIDEAHNLDARARDLYSPRLALSTVEALHHKGLVQLDSLEGEIAADTTKLKKRWSRLTDKALETLRECASQEETEVIESGPRGGRQTSVAVRPRLDSFAKLEAALGRFLTLYAQKQELLKPTDPIFELFKKWSELCAVMRLGGVEFLYTWQDSGEDAALQVTCCEASRFLKGRMQALHAVTAFSATLKPFSFYRQMCGFEEGTSHTCELESPFPPENRKLLIIPQISTAYRDRQRNYEKINQVIEKVISLRKGNYFVFFPSFVFLAEVEKHVKLPGFRLFFQKPGQTLLESQEILQKFRQKRKNVVVFAVQGGSFSEGIDLPGEDLVGALIIGPSLPGFDLERECLKAYYQKRYGRGFDYAYVYPAMARVVQAAGRVLRTPQDKGLIVLADKRFTQQNYLDVMPQDWLKSGVQSLVSQSILSDIQAFWEQNSPVKNAVEEASENAEAPISLSDTQETEESLSEWVPKFPKPSKRPRTTLA